MYYTGSIQYVLLYILINILYRKCNICLEDCEAPRVGPQAVWSPLRTGSSVIRPPKQRRHLNREHRGGFVFKSRLARTVARLVMHMYRVLVGSRSGHFLQLARAIALKLQLPRAS